MKLRINAGDKSDSNGQDKAITDTYGKNFNIPLDFEMLDSVMLYYQVGLRNRLSHKIMCNKYRKVINLSKQAPSLDAMYKITDIALEYEIVKQPDLTSLITMEYQNMTLQYDRILGHKQIIVNKSETIWDWSLNTSCKFLNGILVLFQEEQSYA